jgi:hypothetical protein
MIPRSRLAAVLTVALATSGTAFSQSSPSPLQSTVWDCSITVPAGGYRSTKPIALPTNAEITVEPDAFLDGIAFDATGRAQHWKISDAFFRNVSISAQMGSSLDAKNTAFENCIFTKTGNWYTQWWSTRWGFENCLFSRTFMHEWPLSTVNQSAAARNSTFVGISLPAIELKGDCKYLQGGAAQYVNCRFVRCAVPRSFLAATVDCLFDSCTFPPTRESWPREAVPIQVKAYLLGTTMRPQTLEAGPLKVEFLAASKDMTAGCDFPFTMSGATIQLKNRKLPQQFRQIGTNRTKKASEIP